jgi:hypothetical protein
VTRSNARREQASRPRDDFFRQSAPADGSGAVNRGDYLGMCRHRPDAMPHGESARADRWLTKRVVLGLYRTYRPLNILWCPHQQLQNPVFHSRVHGAQQQ